MTHTASTSVENSDTQSVFLHKTAAYCAVAGTIAVFGALALLGEVPRGDPVAVLEHVNERPWRWMRLLGLLGVLAWAVAFAALARSVRGPRARAIASVAQPLMAVAVAVFTVDYAVDGLSIAEVGEAWANNSAPPDLLVEQAQLLELIAGAASILSQALLGLALLVFAVALLFAADFPKVLSWIGIAASAGWFLGGALLFAGVSWVSFELFLPFSMIAMLWVAAVGVVAWRRGSRPARAA